MLFLYVKQLKTDFVFFKNHTHLLKMLTFGKFNGEMMSGCLMGQSMQQGCLV